MTYETYPAAGPAPEYFHHDDEDRGNALISLTNIAGALVSVGLIVGVGVWGYKLMVRDVSGIPIVQASKTPMRVAPDNPGGTLARNQGLAVNAIAAEGNAEAPADKLILAPQPVVLTAEDQPLDQNSVAVVQQAVADQNDVDQAKAVDVALRAGSVEGLVAELTNTAFVAPTARIDAPGLTRSLRPQLRPAKLVVPTAVTAPPEEIAPASLPAGTRLVQLGAFESAEVARSEWAKFAGKFEDLMQGKARVVQKAQSGGREFYRLRAHGFADLSDARRFCSALLAEGADCIPVITR